jgi:hypothetical protein
MLVMKQVSADNLVLAEPGLSNVVVSRDGQYVALASGETVLVMDTVAKARPLSVSQFCFVLVAPIKTISPLT